ncbi:MAG: cell division protein FtsL [Deltaproteobacteria bacterium]|nr:cell division protein FtsL [Deltaproteobacteria bacterium]
MKSGYVLRMEVDNAYLVRTRDRRRRRELLAILIAAAPVGLALLAYSWTHLQVLEAGYRIDSLRRELHATGQSERHLRLEVARLANPRMIEKRATEELGMEPPGAQQWVVLEPIQ